MFKSIVGWKFLKLVVLSLLMGRAASAVTVSLQAVKVNGVSITATNSVNVQPGDRITADIFLSGWGPNPANPSNPHELKNYQVELDSSGFTNGIGQALFTPHILCADDSTCTDDPSFGAGSSCDPTDYGNPSDPINDCTAGFIDFNRSNYIFNLVSEVAATDVSGPDFRWGGIVLTGSLVADTGAARYGGTLVVDIPLNAAGDYVVSFWGEPKTFVLDENNNSILPLGFIPLTIHLPSVCPVPAMISTNPASCAIDARQPTNLDGTNPQGFKSFTLTFNNACVLAGGVTDEDLAVREVPNGGAVPFISSVLVNGAQLTVGLNLSIDPGKWTCIEHLPSGIEKCWGYLPADANADRTAGAVDIIELIDHLNGVGTPLPIHSCDIDRSNACAAPDIIRLIDLLNGASAFNPWLGATLPACPSL